MVIAGPIAKQAAARAQQLEKQIAAAKQLPFYKQPAAARELEAAARVLINSLLSEILFLERDLDIERAANSGQVRITGREGFKWQVML